MDRPPLASEAVEGAAQGGAMVIWGSCSALDSITPDRPITEILPAARRGQETAMERPRLAPTLARSPACPHSWTGRSARQHNRLRPYASRQTRHGRVTASGVEQNAALLQACPRSGRGVNRTQDQRQEFAQLLRVDLGLLERARSDKTHKPGAVVTSSGCASDTKIGASLRWSHHERRADAGRT